MGRPLFAIALEQIGDSVAAAQIDYAASVWRDWNGVSVPSPTEAAEGMVGGAEITVLMSMRGIFENAGLIALRGTLSVGDDGERGFVPETDGFGDAYPLSNPSVLELAAGHIDGEEFRAKYREILATLPKLAPLTRADLEALPPADNDGDGDDTKTEIKLVVFGTRMSFGPPGVPGCLWLFYDNDEGILNGYGYMPEGSGWESEYGSAYDRDIVSKRGLVKVVNLGEGLLFRDVVMQFDSLNDREAYASVVAGKITRL